MGIFDPQGLPSSPTSQTNTSSGIAAWAQPYISNMLTQGQQLANQGSTGFQNQVYDSAQNMGTPGQFAQGSNLLNQSGAGMLGTTGTALGYGQQASGAGQAYQNMATDPSQMQQWMNPYIQQALNPQLQLLNQQQALAGQGIAAKASGQGAFGGNRATLAQGLNQQNYALAGQQAIGQGYNEAFKQAQQAQQFRSDLGLRGLNTALQGVDTAQRGYAGATQAGIGLGNIGSQQGQYDISKLGLQNQIANQQYNLPYQRLQFMQGLLQGLPVSTSATTGYQSGPNALSQMSGLIGTGVTGAMLYNQLARGGNNNSIPNISGSGGATTGQVWGSPGTVDTSYGAGNAYNNMSTDEIANMQEYGLAKGGEVKRYAEGGQIKGYAPGGIASINRSVMNDPTAYSEQTINRGAQDNVLGGVTKLLALDTIAKQRAAMQAQQAMQAQPQQPILAQLQQQAMPQQMAQGIDNAESNLPQQYAGGGIIAFNGEERSDVPAPKYISELPEYIKSKLSPFLSGLREQVNTGKVSPGATWNPAVQAVPEVVVPPTDAKPDELGRYKADTDTSGIVIHPTTPRVVGSGIAAAPTIPMQSSRADAGAGINDLIKDYADQIKGSGDFDNSQKMAGILALGKFFTGMMGGTSPYALTNVGAAGNTALDQYGKELSSIQDRKDKQLSQLMSLGLKGEELKMAAKKIGIDETELAGKLPLYAAQAKYYGAKGAGVGSGGISAGSIGAKDYFARKDMYNAFALNPRSNPELYSTLPQKVQDALKATPGSPSYQRGLEEVRKITDRMMAQDINEARAVGAKKVPLSSIED